MKKQITRSYHLIITLAIVITIITGLLLLLLNNTTEALNSYSGEVSQFVNMNLYQTYLLFGLIALAFLVILHLLYRSYKLRIKSESENVQFREKSALKKKKQQSQKNGIEILLNLPRMQSPFIAMGKLFT